MLDDRAITQVRLRPWLADGHGLSMKAFALSAMMTASCMSLASDRPREIGALTPQMQWRCAISSRRSAYTARGATHGDEACRQAQVEAAVILSINGLTPHAMVRMRIRTGVDEISQERMAWALNAAAAGYRGQGRKTVLLRGGERMTVEPGDPPLPKSGALVSARMIGDIGYIRFNDSLGNTNTVEAFDAGDIIAVVCLTDDAMDVSL